jgi:hypothetical protein
MPQPTLSDVHVNRPLTNVSVAYIQSQSDFIADKIFPIIPVESKSDIYFVYKKDSWFRDEAKPRAPSTESVGSGYDIDNTQTYTAIVNSFHKDVDDQTRANSDSPLSPDADAVRYVTRKLLLKREKDWSTKFFKTGVWSADVTPGTLWSAAGSTPIEDVRKQAVTIQQGTGFYPNTLVLGRQVWQILQDHPEFLDRIKYQGSMVDPARLAGPDGPRMLAQILELDRVLIAAAVQNTAAEGVAFAGSFLYGKNALLAYVPTQPGLYVPSSGYTFSWKGYTGAGIDGTRIKTFRMEHLEANRVEGDMAYDQHLVGSDLGTFFNGAVA